MSASEGNADIVGRADLMGTGPGPLSHCTRHRIEAVDHDVALGLIDAHRHVKSAVVKLLVQDFRVAMQPADAGPVSRVN